MSEQVATVLDGIVRVPGIGGFPVDNIAYWKITTVKTGGGEDDVLHIQFRTGGFLDVPLVVMAEEEFVSLVYGLPY